MKRLCLCALAVGLTMTACEKPQLAEKESGNVTLSFIPTTADIPVADSQTRATVTIGDYFTKLNVMLFNADGEKVFDKVRTQTIDDTDFGNLNMSLAAGTYTVVAVGHSSIKSATIKSPQMVQFTATDGEKLTDTFCHCGQVTVSESGGRHELVMNRVCAMLRFRFTDTDIPSSFARLKIDYTGGSANFNPTTGEGCTKSTQSESRLPAAEYQVFTFPYLATDGVLKVTVSALTADDAVIRQRTFTNIPVTRNRITTYTGKFFEDGDGNIVQTGFGISVNPEWDGENEYEF